MVDRGVIDVVVVAGFIPARGWRRGPLLEVRVCHWRTSEAGTPTTPPGGDKPRHYNLARRPKRYFRGSIERRIPLFPVHQSPRRHSTPVPRSPANQPLRL